MCITLHYASQPPTRRRNQETQTCAIHALEHLNHQPGDATRRRKRVHCSAFTSATTNQMGNTTLSRRRGRFDEQHLHLLSTWDIDGNNTATDQGFEIIPSPRRRTQACTQAQLQRLLNEAAAANAHGQYTTASLRYRAAAALLLNCVEAHPQMEHAAAIAAIRDYLVAAQRAELFSRHRSPTCHCGGGQIFQNSPSRENQERQARMFSTCPCAAARRWRQRRWHHQHRREIEAAQERQRLELVASQQAEVEAEAGRQRCLRQQAEATATGLRHRQEAQDAWRRRQTRAEHEARRRADARRRAVALQEAQTRDLHRIATAAAAAAEPSAAAAAGARGTGAHRAHNAQHAPPCPPPPAYSRAAATFTSADAELESEIDAVLHHYAPPATLAVLPPSPPSGFARVVPAPMSPGTQVTVVLLTHPASIRHNNRRGVVVSQPRGTTVKAGRVPVLLDGDSTPVQLKVQNVRIMASTAVATAGADVAFDDLVSILAR